MYFPFIFRCPDVCKCEGLTVDCSNSTWTNDTLSASISTSTRLLDICKRPKLLSFFDLDQTSFHYLIYLNLSHCQITNLSTYMLGSMRNLLVLDLSNNWLHTISSNIFVHQSRLQLLRLNANLEMFTIESDAFYGLSSLSALQLTHHQIDRILMSSFVSLTLEKLEIYHSVIQHIDGMAFEQLRVKSLYLNTTVFESVSADMFQGLESLQFLVTDEFSLCCIKPDYLDGQNCLPHSDAFSSCSDLMRNEVLRALIWVIGIFSLFGNSASFMYYLVFEREKFKLGYGMFVSNLAISDFLMGAYLIIIAGTDMYYRGDYSMYDKTWKNSPLCKFAGTIAALSNETSILFIGLITLDRVLVVKYPFGDFRIDRIQARVLTAVAWSIGLGLSLIPFVITSYFGNEFYSKSGVCLALPLTKQKLPGWEYSICVFIGLNFLLTLLIILGQWMIYHEVMATKLSLANNVSSRKTDLKIARNLLFVALTDLLCWFPVGLLGNRVF